MIENVAEGHAAVGELTARLLALPAAADDAARIARLRALEELKAAAAAVQAREAATFAQSQRAEQATAGVRREHAGRGIANQVALALRCSPHRAQRYLGWASILTGELPETFAALAEGRTTEWRAQLVARETIFLSRSDRERVDAAIAPRLERLGDRAVEAETKRLAYRLDPEGFVARARAAADDRRVGVRPAPEAMARLTALLPVAQAVACHAALARTADTTTAAGDRRGRGQIMADTLVERLTGQARAGDVPVEINLVMTERTLLEGDGEPAVVEGYGYLPAGIARALLTDTDAPVWLRQLYTHPRTGQLTATTSRRRFAAGGLRRFVQLRDQYCRTPWCGAPLRQVDHVVPDARGGPTSLPNSQGYCQSCNLAKEAPGWSARVIPMDGRHLVELRTPTGHRYHGRPPDPPGAPGAPGAPRAA